MTSPIPFLLFAICAASTNMKCSLKLQKEILVYMTNLVEYKGSETFNRRRQDADSGTGSDRSAFLRCNACFKDTFIFAVRTIVVWSCLWSDALLHW